MRLALAVAVTCLSIIGATAAADVAASIKKQTDIPAQQLGGALRALAKEHEFQIIYLADAIETLPTSGAVGQFTVDEALQKLLSGSGLVYKYVDDRTVSIFAVGTQRPAPRAEPDGAGAKKSFWSAFRIAQSGAEGATPGAAQGSDKATSENPTSAALEEVVVTAQKRPEHLMEVPIAISAIGEQQLQRLGITGLEDLSHNVPSLNFAVLSPGELRLSMRGLTTASALSPVVGYYLDDTAFDLRGDTYTGSAPSIDMFDIDRVEVLRGPQGTLFGAGSMGGAVRLITARPDPTQRVTKLEAGAATTRGGDPSYVVKAALNQPISDSLAIRLVATRDEVGGFIDRATPQDYFNLSAGDPIAEKNENDAGVSTVRAALRWTPRDSLAVTPSILFRDSVANGFSFIQADSPRENVRYHDFADKTRSQLTVGSLNVEFNLGFASLTSISSYLHKTSNGLNDFSSTGSGIFASVFGATSQEIVPTTSIRPVAYRELMQEVRLASPTDQRLRWLAGVYYNDTVFDNDQLARSEQLGGLFSMFQGIDPPSDVLVSYQGSSTDRQAALFGEATLRVATRLEFTAGLRAYRLRQSIQSVVNGVLASDPYVNTSSSKSGLNPKFTLAWRAREELNTYVSASKGFRPGGPNASLLSNLTCTYLDVYKPAYDPDYVWTYEAGAKGVSPNGRASFGVAAYRTNWSGVQGFVASNCGTFQANFGEARVDGVELELTWRPLEQLLLSGSASHNDASFTRIGAGFQPSIPIQEGDRVVNVPREQYSVSGEWAFPLAARISGYVRADAQYVGSTPISYTDHSSLFTKPAYTNIDFSIGTRMRDLELALSVRNVTDRLQVVDASPASNFSPFWTVAPPRTVSVLARYQFN